MGIIKYTRAEGNMQTSWWLIVAEVTFYECVNGGGAAQNAEKKSAVSNSIFNRVLLILRNTGQRATMVENLLVLMTQLQIIMTRLKHSK